MPIHDWTRVDTGIFHDFHHAWIEELKRGLNRGLLPPDHYALAEQIASEAPPQTDESCRIGHNIAVSSCVVEMPAPLDGNMHTACGR